MANKTTVSPSAPLPAPSTNDLAITIDGERGVTAGCSVTRARHFALGCESLNRALEPYTSLCTSRSQTAGERIM